MGYSFFLCSNSNVMNGISFDCVVVGSGLAGLYTAYCSSRFFGRIALITKQELEESNSYHAQGGVAAATDSGDSPINHYKDTMEAGRGLCVEEAVHVLTEEAPERIRDFVSLGMRFDKDDDGRLSRGREGGHHFNRILHAGGDSTGREMTSFMISKVLSSPNIHTFPDRQAVSLLTDENGCYGVRVWNSSEGREEHFFGHHVVMATGGSAALYCPTTNPRETIGDGISICSRAGAGIRDMEFVQFHPTALYSEDGEAFLISEAVRGEGAYLLNEKGERFMAGRHELAELAPRDVVAREIFMQIRSSSLPYVRLSMRHLDRDTLLRRFPTIAQHCAAKGYDFTDWIPVAPAAHYTVGGVETDLYGRSSVPHLYVVGELASTGLMGANRLASNSLIECLVFGYRISTFIQRHKGHALPNADVPYVLGIPRHRDWYDEIRRDLSRIMMSHVGIVRNAEGLLCAQKAITKLRNRYEYDASDLYCIFAHQLLDVAELIVKGALDRCESRGGHYREGYPGPNDLYRHHSHLTLDSVDCHSAF